ncbi:MAG: SAM hydrolase/SAM-dependent halogenase family protein [Steroidobacteraceae bacterium]
MPTAAVSAPFRSSGIVTLTTDFGLVDPFVGVLKGQILQRFGAARIVDLTHAVTVHRPAEAGFWLGRSFGYFPAGTVHVAVVDPGVGGTRSIAVLEAEGHLFLAPDNGLLSGVVERLTAVPVIRLLDLELLPWLGIRPPSSTFHGRDIFAPIAAEVASGRLPPEQLGFAGAQLVSGAWARPRLEPGQATGVVMTVDHFGNLLTNLDAVLLADLPDPVVRAGGRNMPLQRTYSDARPGEYLALVNSFGVLEIARAEMSAAAGLGMGPGAPVVVQGRGRCSATRSG